MGRGSGLRLADDPAFRVLGGNHDGVSWKLEAGSCLVGRAEHCDVVLSDAEVPDEAVLLTVGPNGIIARGLAGQPVVRLGARGEERAAPQIDLREGHAVLVGAAALLFGHARSDWNGIERAGRRRLRAWSATESGDHAIHRHARPAERARALMQRRPVLSAALGLAAFGIVIGGAFGSISHRMTPPAQFSGDRLKEYVQETIDERQLKDVEVVRRGDGIMVQGFVPDQASATRLRDTLHGTRTVVSVHSVDEVRRYVTELFAARGLTAEVSYEGHGAFTVSGRARKADGFDKAFEHVRAELPWLKDMRLALTEIPETVMKPSPPKDDPLVLGGVNGVNMGPKTKYITSGSNYIFSGGVLQNGTTIVDIESGRVIVDDKTNGKRMDVTIR